MNELKSLIENAKKNNLEFELTDNSLIIKDMSDKDNWRIIHEILFA